MTQSFFPVHEEIGDVPQFKGRPEIRLLVGRQGRIGLGEGRSQFNDLKGVEKRLGSSQI